MKTVAKGFAIAVLDRGFVYVGEAEVSDDWLVLTNAKNIRCWGTKDGLGELALKGPNSKTKLDAAGTVRVPRRALIHLLDTDAEKWNVS